MNIDVAGLGGNDCLMGAQSGADGDHVGLGAAYKYMDVCILPLDFFFD